MDLVYAQANCVLFDPSFKGKKRTFTILEDATLLNLVNRLGKKNWKEIARMIPGRTERQCRERYKTYLAPGIRNDPWTIEEDELLTQKVLEIGPKWAEISRFFMGRTDNALKNRYNIHITHRPHPRKKKQMMFNEMNNITFPSDIESKPFDITWDIMDPEEYVFTL